MLTTQIVASGGLVLVLGTAAVLPYTEKLDASSSAAVELPREGGPPPVDEGDRLVARTTGLVDAELKAGLTRAIEGPSPNLLGTQVQSAVSSMMAAYQELGAGDWLGAASAVAGQVASVTESSMIDTIASGLELAKTVRDVIGTCTTSVVDCAFDLPVVLGRVGELGKVMAYTAAPPSPGAGPEYRFAEGIKLTPYDEYLAQQGTDVQATLAEYERILAGDVGFGVTPASVKLDEPAPAPAPALVPDPRVPGRRELALGLSGPDVYSLQVRLGVEANGKVDRATLDAFAAWRARQGLAPSEQVTLADLRALGVPTGYDLGKTDTGLVYPAIASDPVLAEKIGANEHVLAFLMAVQVGEGTNQAEGYSTGFGGARFDPLLGHPGALDPDLFRQNLARYGLPTDASGKYQFLSDTWHPTVVALNRRLEGTFEVGVARDGVNRFDERFYRMDPVAQDAAAVQLLIDIGAYEVLRTGDIKGAVARSATTWSSLPGGPEPNDLTPAFWANYDRALAALRARRTSTPGPR